ncbi:MAG: FtsX-like permease family protein [Planctomycetes bacterium]|nr:FtsX-like permease family protein [Planctomycetota bacterium]
MRTIAFLVRRSLRQHALSTAVTAGAAALACGLVLSVFSVTAQARDAFVRDPGFDAVLGARGSELQLVLNSVFHLETSPGNIPWSLYREFKEDPRVELAIPYAVGDNYRGFRIVGTTPEIFEVEYAKGRRYGIAVAGGQRLGRFFQAGNREAVLGSYVAEATGLKVNDAFNPTHGTDEDGHVHEDEYTVTGILAPTNTPADRVVWIPIEGIFHMEGHVLRGTGEEHDPEPEEEIADEHKEVSAVMLRLKGEAAGFALKIKARASGVATLAWPIANVMQDLFDKLFWFVRILEIVAYLVVAVSMAGILASLYNTMNERRREFAILRALGARKGTVFASVVSEAATIAAVGALGGYVVHALVVAAAAYTLRTETGVVLDPFAYHPVLWAAPLGILALGAIAGLLPATKAYRTDVASNLAPVS